MVISISDPSMIGLMMTVLLVTFGKVLYHYITVNKDDLKEDKKERTDG